MPSVFIAEDEDELRSLFKELLESKGYNVLGLVKNGQEVVDTVLQLPEMPNLYILDQRMPQKSGFEASQEILKYNPDAKFLFMSGDDGMMNMLEGKGNMGLILKPFLLSTFLDAVNTMLNGNGPNNGSSCDYNLFCNK
jgi:CheY-like chemotaxis protein